ncbi:ecto-ADP-ribosyltransferase 4-like isoform X2 [Parambassis ranga]|uniref:NAD(P)(+)--arginine ADP-ribosyltransferase n=1 Tax=Parambassis ranga TaxID=210632 RepID=A0A6P7IXV0_9TELE|nr:ecto-ADP-ribosyltransferase 4-like isoform X2 [Parambassis ranga]
MQRYSNPLAKSELKDENPLDMAPNSVDDMYDGCLSEMEKDVEDKYLKNEMNENKNFTEAWEKAEEHYEWKNWQLAIYVYTLPNVYLDFNTAVRNQSSKYNTTFSYHSLHFYLTQAIQNLTSNRPDEVDPAKCYTVYRRTKSYFSLDVLYREFRFGSFTSSSQGNYQDTQKFGNKSCFKIRTCFGADISKYSNVSSQREVLIPPYEVFKVTKIEKISDNKGLPCEVVYEVDSTETNKSNLNCALFKSNSDKSNGTVSSVMLVFLMLCILFLFHFFIIIF